MKEESKPRYYVTVNITWIKVRPRYSLTRGQSHSSSIGMADMSSGPLPTAQTYTQPYSTYPQAYSQYSTQQFSSVNYSSQPQGALYSAFQVPYGRKDPTSWIDALSPQELSAVDPEIASRAMNRSISAELKYEGFDAAEHAALSRLEDEVVHCGSHVFLTRLAVLTVIALVIQDLHRKIHDYANLANRTTPLVSDMFDICQECGLETDGLRLTSELSKLRSRGTRWSGIIVSL